MAEKTTTNELHEQGLKSIISSMSDIMQQAQFAAINIAIAADRVNKELGRDNELGRILDQLAAQVSDAMKRIECISKVATEGLNYFDFKSFTKKKDELESGTLKKLEESFTIILENSQKVMDLLKRIKPVREKD